MSKGAGINGRYPEIHWGALWLHPPCPRGVVAGRRVTDSYKYTPPHVGYHVDFDRYWSNGMYGRDPPKKDWALMSRLSRSLKDIGNDMNRSGIYDCLLMFHGNHMPILYRFQVTARYCPKIAIFMIPRLFNVYLRGSRGIV